MLVPTDTVRHLQNVRWWIIKRGGPGWAQQVSRLNAVLRLLGYDVPQANWPAPDTAGADPSQLVRENESLKRRLAKAERLLKRLTDTGEDSDD